MKRFLLGIFALAAVCLGTAVAQMWPNFPIVGGASYCQSTVNGTCVSTIPAGPALTGNETVPADTNLANGANPQTVKMSVMSLGGGLFTYNVPLSGDTITLTSQTRQLVINPAGTIGALTIVGPASTNLVQGQMLGICTTQIVTALTLTAGSGTTFAGAPTAMLVPVTTGGGSCPEWIYRAANTTWYRVH